MAFCIRKDKIEEFKQALKNKKLDVFELMKMDSAERTAEFEKFAGKDAQAMNVLFEQKLILKNQVQGIKNWVSKVGEMGRYDPAKKAKLDELLSEYKSRQQERMLNPKENEGFLESLIEEKLGVRISKEQAKVAWDIQVKADEYFKSYDVAKETWSSPEAEAKYGASKVIYKNYLDSLRKGNLSLKETFKGYKQETKQLWEENKYDAVKKVVEDSVSTISNTMINAVASFDNSFMGRQGAITMVKSPKTWWNMARESMNDFYAGLKGQGNIRQDALMAKVYSHPDYINGKFEKAKLNFGVEEEIPTELLERAPVVGRVFKASNISFVDSAIRARMGLWDIMKKVDQAKGIELSEAGLKDRGNIINSITARGKTGQVLSSKPVQLVLWAPKMMKADWNILTGHTFGFGLETKGARVEAAKTITNVVIATAAITAIAEAMGADVEKDPRSTDFLKIKIGNTRINTPFARSMPQLVTLFSRLLTQESKSSTGVISKLNSGEYGSKSLFDVGVDFLVNKTNPPSSAVLAWMRGRDFAGQKPTVGKTAFRFLPIAVQNFLELDDTSDSAEIIGAFVDLFGVSANTYSQKTDWGQSTGKELLQFKEKVGEDKFVEANDKFNKLYSDWLLNVMKDPKYLSLSDDDKQKLLTKKKASIKDQIFKEYRFKYKQEKVKPNPIIKELSK